MHDTAIGYHKKLREKELTKSALDEISGIGEVKKKALLKKFGSVKKIAEADVEEISKIKGINERISKKNKRRTTIIRKHVLVLHTEIRIISKFHEYLYIYKNIDRGNLYYGVCKRYYFRH